MTQATNPEPILARDMIRHYAESLVGGLDAESRTGAINLALTGPRGSGVSTALRQITNHARAAGADVYELRPEDIVSVEAMSRALQRQGPFRAKRFRAAGLPPEGHQPTTADRVFAATARLLSGQPQPPARPLTEAEVDALPPAWPIRDEYYLDPLRRVQKAAKLGVMLVVDEAHRVAELVDDLLRSHAGRLISKFDEHFKRDPDLERTVLLLGGDSAVDDVIGEVEERHWNQRAIQPMDRAEIIELVTLHLRAGAGDVPLAETAATAWATPLAEAARDYPQFAADAGRAAADYLRANPTMATLSDEALAAVIADFEGRRDAFLATVLRDAAQPPSDRATVEAIRSQLRESNNQIDSDSMRFHRPIFLPKLEREGAELDIDQMRQQWASILRRLCHSGLIENMGTLSRIYGDFPNQYAYHAPIPGILDAPWPSED